MKYLKELCKKTSLRTVKRTSSKIDVQDALFIFDDACRLLSDREFLMVIGNVVAERAVDRGTGGQFMDKACIEIESRKDEVLNFIHS